MKVLGMQVCPKSETDQQYVESVRKRISRSKWFALFHACFFVLFLGIYLFLWRLIYVQDAVLAAAAGPGMSIGIALGAFGGLMLALAAQSAIWAVRSWQGDRAERLMLRFYDELRRSQTGVQPCAAPNGGPAPPLGSPGVTEGPPSVS